ncbi:MAG TPA: alpha/beta hydrolase [Ramlibacter sp.]
MFLKTSDADLYVSECGSVGGNTIVAHGGWVGSGELWQQPFEALSRRWRCITYDHRGTGATRHRGGPITPGMLVDDLFRVLDARKVERCVLAGESAGGLTVLEAARRAPERFSGLVLVDARYEGSLSAGAKKRVEGCKLDFAATMQQFVNACIPEPDCEAERAWAFKIVMRSSAQHAVELLEGLAHVDMTGDLDRIHVPTLLIHGVEDVIRPLSESEFMHSRITGSRLVKLERVGHVPTITRPSRVAAEIESFFR